MLVNTQIKKNFTAAQEVRKLPSFLSNGFVSALAELRKPQGIKFINVSIPLQDRLGGKLYLVFALMVNLARKFSKSPGRPKEADFFMSNNDMLAELSNAYIKMSGRTFDRRKEELVSSGIITVTKGVGNKSIYRLNEKMINNLLQNHIEKEYGIRTKIKLAVRLRQNGVSHITTSNPPYLNHMGNEPIVTKYNKDDYDFEFMNCIDRPIYDEDEAVETNLEKKPKEKNKHASLPLSYYEKFKKQNRLDAALRCYEKLEGHEKELWDILAKTGTITPLLMLWYNLHGYYKIYGAYKDALITPGVKNIGAYVGKLLRNEVPFQRDANKEKVGVPT